MLYETGTRIFVRRGGAGFGLWRRWGGGGGCRRFYQLDSRQYQELVRESLDKDTREQFWERAAKDLVWTTPWEDVLDVSKLPFSRWFVGGEMSICFNALDRHVQDGFGKQVAVQFDSTAVGIKRSITYEELLKEVSEFANVLKERGVNKGDRVVIYMPMIPEAVVAMLATARLGAVQSVVFGGFAPKELSARINDAQPAAIVAASCSVEPSGIVQYEPMLRKALEMSKHKCEAVIVKHRSEVESDLNPPTNFLSFDKLLEENKGKTHEAVPVKSTDPLYIIYTSGTTGQPKGIVRDTGGYAVALKWAMHNFMDLRPGETYFAASDIGWVVGQSFGVWSPLLARCTTVIYEGKPILPNAGVFWRIAEEYGVKSMFAAPTAMRAIRKADPDLDLMKGRDLAKLKCLFLAGERADPATVAFFARKLGKPIVDNYWSSELGWPALGYQKRDVGAKPGSASCSLPGFEVHVVHEEESIPLPHHHLGDIVIKIPLPPGTFQTLYNNDERCKKTYYDKHFGYFLTGDSGIVDPDGYFHVMSRTDDVINCAGHRLSSGAIEEVLSSNLNVVECAVIGAYDKEKGQVPVALFVMKDGVEEERVVEELVAKVREDIGPVASFKHAFAVRMLPKTRSGKTLRAVLLQIADQKEIRVPGTIEDPAAVDHVKEILTKRWIAQKSA